LNTDRYEPLTKEERLAYCRVVDEMVHAAKAVLLTLDTGSVGDIRHLALTNLGTKHLRILR